jgi:hypothetical protein
MRLIEAMILFEHAVKNRSGHVKLFLIKMGFGFLK